MPWLFLARQVYAPLSVLLSTWCSISVPFADTSCLRLVGRTCPSAEKKKKKDDVRANSITRYTYGKKFFYRRKGREKANVVYAGREKFAKGLLLLLLHDRSMDRLPNSRERDGCVWVNGEKGCVWCLVKKGA